MYIYSQILLTRKRIYRQLCLRYRVSYISVSYRIYTRYTRYIRIYVYIYTYLVNTIYNVNFTYISL